MLNTPERVRLWNTFYDLRGKMKNLFEIRNHCASSQIFKPKGGMLDEERRVTLSTVVFCTLAIEARANHVIQKLREANRITKQECEAAQRLSPEAKWFLLPKLAGRRQALRANSGPLRQRARSAPSGMTSFT